MLKLQQQQTLWIAWQRLLDRLAEVQGGLQRSVPVNSAAPLVYLHGGHCKGPCATGRVTSFSCHLFLLFL